MSDYVLIHREGNIKMPILIIFLFVLVGLVGFEIGYYFGVRKSTDSIKLAIMKILYDTAKQDEKEGNAK